MCEGGEGLSKPWMSPGLPARCLVSQAPRGARLLPDYRLDDDHRDSIYSLHIICLPCVLSARLELMLLPRPPVQIDAIIVVFNLHVVVLIKDLKISVSSRPPALAPLKLTFLAASHTNGARRAPTRSLLWSRAGLVILRQVRHPLFAHPELPLSFSGFTVNHPYFIACYVVHCTKLPSSLHASDGTGSSACPASPLSSPTDIMAAR